MIYQWYINAYINEKKIETQTLYVNVDGNKYQNPIMHFPEYHLEQKSHGLYGSSLILNSRLVLYYFFTSKYSGLLVLSIPY